MFGAPQIVSCGGGGGGSGGRQGGLGQSLAGPSLCHTDAQWVPARLGSGPCWGRGTQDGCQASVRTSQGSALWAADADLACWAQEVHPRGELGAIGRV